MLPKWRQPNVSKCSLFNTAIFFKPIYIPQIIWSFHVNLKLLPWVDLDIKSALRRNIYFIVVIKLYEISIKCIKNFIHYIFVVFFSTRGKYYYVEDPVKNPGHSVVSSLVFFSWFLIGLESVIIRRRWLFIYWSPLDTFTL